MGARMRYAPFDEPVRVSASAHAGQVEVRVIDGAPAAGPAVRATF